MSQKVDDSRPVSTSPQNSSAPSRPGPDSAERERFRDLMRRSDGEGGQAQREGREDGASLRSAMSDAFKKLLKPEDQKSGGGKSQDGRDGFAGGENDGAGPGGLKESNDPGAVMSGLAGLRASLQPPGGPAPPSDQMTMPRAGEIDNLVRDLVSQMLVSAPGAGQSEVRLTLGQDFLPETSIRLARGPDGLLTVSITASRPESFQTLVAALDPLHEALEKTEGGQQIRLTLNDGREDGAEGDARRRSRGEYLDGSEPDEGQPRSRDPFGSGA